MNEIGAGIQEIKDCKFCQKIINHNFEAWEINAKTVQTQFKEVKYCEHLGVFERNLYKENKDFFYKWEPKGKNTNFFCTNSCCITADNGTRPDLVIYKTNAYGDEWQDSNHTFQKAESSAGIQIGNIVCKNCNQRNDDQGEEQEKTKKYGSDYSSLKTQQQEGRQTTYNNWEEKRKKNYSRNKVCRYCPQKFAYDKKLEYLPAKNKVESE